MHDLDHPIFEEIPDLWHLIVETMDEALFLVDLDRDVLYFNRRAEEITGYSAEEVVGRHCLVAFRCASCAARCRLFEEERIAGREAVITRKDGAEVHVLKNAVALRNPKGEIVGGLETFRDITLLRSEMRRCGLARARAEDREKTLDAVLGSIREGIIALDRDHKVVSVSRRAREILGLEDEANAIGSHCTEVIGAELCGDGCPLAAPPDRSIGVAPLRRSLTVRGRTVSISEGLSPMVDDDGKSVGHILILTELPTSEDEHQESFFGILGRSQSMLAVIERIRQLSHSEVTVLITGESGTGKELAARALHETSLRSRGPFMAVNCAALPEGLLESEIFGHVKGAFTSAVRDRKGRVELAQQGTLFLDEVGELPLPLQAKLLRLLQERTFERLGDEQTRKADIRVIAATNRDLQRAVEQGEFRDDLYYRLKVVPVRMPPLKERGRDIALLAARFLDRIANSAGRPNMHLTRDAMESLVRYPWPGNVRELHNAIEYVVALSPGDSVSAQDLPPEMITSSTASSSGGASTSTSPYYAGSEADVSGADEAQIVIDALERNGWHRINTAEDLGINRVTLYRIMKRHGIEGPRGRRRSPLIRR